MSSPHGHPHGELHNVDTAHEHSDINIQAIVAFVVMLAAITLSVQGAMYGVLKVLNMIEAKDDPVVSPLAPPAGQQPPAPQLQTTPWADLKKLRADEALSLHSYGWVDQQAGVARMPIDKAKALLLQKGIPVRPELGDETEGTRVASTGESSGGRNLPVGGADKSTPAAPGAGGAPGASGASGASGAPGTSGAQGARGAAGAATPKKPGGGQ